MVRIVTREQSLVALLVGPSVGDSVHPKHPTSRTHNHKDGNLAGPPEAPIVRAAELCQGPLSFPALRIWTCCGAFYPANTPPPFQYFRQGSKTRKSAPGCLVWLQQGTFVQHSVPKAFAIRGFPCPTSHRATRPRLRCRFLRSLQIDSRRPSRSLCCWVGSGINHDRFFSSHLSSFVVPWHLCRLSGRPLSGSLQPPSSPGGVVSQRG